MAAEEKVEREEVEVEEEASVSAVECRSTMLLLVVARATVVALGAITRNGCADLVAAEALTPGEHREACMLERKTKINLEK